MGLVGDSDVDYPEPDQSWWDRQKRDFKEGIVHLSIVVPEIALYAWVIWMLDLGLFTFSVAYGSGYLAPFLGFPVYLFEDDQPLPGWIELLAQKLDMMDWFVFQFQAFTTRILLVAFIVSCVSALAFVGVGEKLAVVTALVLLALSLPTYLVYYVMSQDDGKEY